MSEAVDTPASSAETAPPPTLGTLGWVFVRYANVTFGGGSATIAVLHEQVVERRRWISKLQFDLSYALSRLTPGTNLLAFCTAVGWLTRRWIGAIITLLAASVPCSVLAVLVTHFYEQWQHNRVVQGALRGAMAAAVAIMFSTAWTFAEPHVKAARGKAIVVIPIALVLALHFSVTPVRILLGAAVLGLLWPAAEKKS